MTEPITSAAPSRNRVRILLVLGVVVLVVAGVATWLGLRGDDAQPIGPIPLAGHDLCADRVRISTSTDAQMTQIAHAVIRDQGIKAVYTETQQQAFRKYQQEFADQPDLLAIARPGALPAAVLVVPIDGVDVHQLATTYRTRFADTKSVEPFTQADSARKLAAIGVTAPPTPCPASGEFSQPSTHK